MIYKIVYKHKYFRDGRFDGESATRYSDKAEAEAEAWAMDKKHKRFIHSVEEDNEVKK